MARAIVWFRSDLRVHDNEAIQEALMFADELLFVYVFDERTFTGKTQFGFRKTDRFRAQFIIDSVSDLRNSLKCKGADLIVRVGKPEQVLFDLCKETKSHRIFCNRERTSDEVHVQDKLEKNLWSIGREIRYSRGKMLYYTADLPFPITQAPDTFFSFKKEVERIVQIRLPLNTEEQELKSSVHGIEYGQIPTLENFAFSKEEIEFQKYLKGGETEALKQLKYFLWDADHISHYKETKNDILGENYSSKLSAYLSLGCLSPKKMANEIFKYESINKRSESTQSLINELMWRDFFRLLAKKYGNRIFQLYGMVQNTEVSANEDKFLFNKWALGQTGMPFIDANMRELNAKGYISNKGRQNVSSFLVNDLKLNWLMGAEYFESKLIDYDPCSNYGNWNFIAGIGNNAKQEKSINILHQAKKYDPEGKYVRKWIPDLEMVPDNLVHTPASMSLEELNRFGIKEIELYRNAVVDMQKWN